MAITTVSRTSEPASQRDPLSLSAPDIVRALEDVRTCVQRALRPHPATSRISRIRKSSASARTPSAATASAARRAAELRQRKEAEATESVERLGDVVRIFLALRDECTSPLAVYAADGRLQVFNKAFEDVTGWGFEELRAAQEDYAKSHPGATSADLQDEVADRLYPLPFQRRRVQTFLNEYLQHDAQRGYTACFTGLHKSDYQRLRDLRKALTAANRPDLADRLEEKGRLPVKEIVAVLPQPVLADLARKGHLRTFRKSVNLHAKTQEWTHDSDRPDEVLKTFTIQFTTLPEAGGSLRIGTDMTERVAAAAKNGLPLSEVLPKPVPVDALGADIEDHPVERLAREYHRRLLSVMGEDPDAAAYDAAAALMDGTVYPVARTLDVLARRGPHQFSIFEQAASGPDGRKGRDFPLYANPARERCTGIPQAQLQKWVADGKDAWILNYHGARLKEVHARLRLMAESGPQLEKIVKSAENSLKSTGAVPRALAEELRQWCSNVSMTVRAQVAKVAGDLDASSLTGGRAQEAVAALRAIVDAGGIFAVDHQFVMNRMFRRAPDGALVPVDLAPIDSDPDQKDGERVLVCSTFPLKRLRFHYNRDETLQRKLDLAFIERALGSSRRPAQAGVTPATAPGAASKGSRRPAVDVGGKTVTLAVDVPAPRTNSPARPVPPAGFDENAETLPG